MVKFLMLEKSKTSSDVGSITIKASIELSGNRLIPQKLFHDNYCLAGHLGTDDWDLLFSSNVRHISNWKREKPFGSTDLKLFTH